jgi:hypothetical protein
VSGDFWTEKDLSGVKEGPPHATLRAPRPGTVGNPDISGVKVPPDEEKNQ